MGWFQTNLAYVWKGKSPNATDIAVTQCNAIEQRLVIFRQYVWVSVCYTCNYFLKFNLFICITGTSNLTIKKLFLCLKKLCFSGVPKKSGFSSVLISICCVQMSGSKIPNHILYMPTCNLVFHMLDFLFCTLLSNILAIRRCHDRVLRGCVHDQIAFNDFQLIFVQNKPTGRKELSSSFTYAASKNLPIHDIIFPEVNEVHLIISIGSNYTSCDAPFSICCSI